jgi:hypothetical protein
MKRRALTILVLALLLAATATIVWADKPIATDAEGNEIAWESSDPSCTKIQSGEITDSAGDPLTVGYDEFGYNYQAHMFNGRYCDYDRDIGGDYCDVQLVMKWNDAWLANTDCDADGLLDRHYGFDSYVGSGAWCTNHQSEEYELDGKTCRWVYFVKIVAAPDDAYHDSGVWYSADGTEIGPAIWGSFAIIQQVCNDPCAGDHGLEYLSPDHAGLGGW